MFGERDPSNLGHQGAGKMLGDVWIYELAAKRWQKLDVGGNRPQARGWFTPTLSERGIKLLPKVDLRKTNTRLGDVWALVF